MHVCTCQKHLHAYNLYVCLHTYIHIDSSIYVQTLIHIYAYLLGCLHTYMHISTWRVMHVWYTHRQIAMFIYKHACLNTCICTYITHTFQPRNKHNFRVQYFHNFQIWIYPVSKDFQKFHTSGVWKSDNSESMKILEIWYLVHLS